MVSKPHRQNSKFQLRYFLAGDCKTPDGAWSLLYGQKIDMEGKIRHSDAQRLRREAKIMAAQEILEDEGSSKSAKLNAKADISEQMADVPVWELNLKAAKMELQDIEDLMAELEPYRKYAHLPLLEATEAAQQEEWLEELKTRAENFIITMGTIPHDHLNTMRCHPDFKKYLVPHIQNTLGKLAGRTLVDALTLVAGQELPLLHYETKEPEQEQKLNYGPRT